MSRVREYSNKEELANTLSHSLGIVLGVIAAFILLPKAYASGNVWTMISVIAYLVGMLSSYISSTLYHSCKNEKRKALYRKYDHAAIYLHIAGTNVPFFLIVLIQEPFWCWPVFAVVAATAVVGVVSSMRRLKTHSYLETICYVLMGATILIAFKPLTEILSQMGSIDAFYWLIAGGISYVVGAVFYSLAKVKYMHTVFHVFVLVGSICHIVAIDKIL